MALTVVFQAAQRRSLVSQVEGELRSALIEGRLKPGARLVTRDIAESLGTSITPVREALVRLVASGALTAEPAQSFRVPVLAHADYAEIAEIRKAVEGLAAGNAAQRIGPADIRRLEALLADYLAARSGEEPAEALQANKAFRFGLYKLADMPNLMDVIETLWLKTGPGFNYLFPQQRNDFNGHRNYEDLLSAMRQRDAAAARAAIEHAIDDGTRVVLRALEERDRSPRDPRPAQAF
ncbi:FCD domain-containing protein [Aureimonas glaciei]|uniref:GntR family transcriptional regulator n=1 Tax=Aureimonas glaciei TaxID=1776957 RepID=A0A917DAB5_9HYPH|nr:FCD domain-containing protein [Aureimonas glaciei]GGD21788.1 GntR family transcriptional regulator [Aureimonas glaciei]